MSEATEVGSVVFRKGQTNEDIWDDTALIKAYDNAVSVMKGRMAEDIVPNEEDSATKKKKKNKKKHKNKNKLPKWKVGDHCLAIFTEDDVVYEAEIRSVDPEAGTCIVRYQGYGNEEEHQLDHLQPIRRPRSQLSHEHVSENESMDWAPGRTPTRPGPSHQKHSSHGRGMPPHPTQGPPGAPPGGWPWPTMTPPMPTMPPMFPGMGMGMGMGFPSPFPMWPGFPMAPTASPSMPPLSMPANFPPMPPPPTLTEDVIGGDKEALSSMLIAWYMTGYHTGYYQGLKEGKKQLSQSGTPQKQDASDTTTQAHRQEAT